MKIKSSDQAIGINDMDFNIILNPNQTTLEEIKELAEFMDTAFYSISTTWWTINRANLYRHPENRLPCDPRGSMLMQGSASKFIANAEANREKYGSYGLDAFVAAYHGNIILQDKGWPTCLNGWDEVNKLLNERTKITD